MVYYEVCLQMSDHDPGQLEKEDLLKLPEEVLRDLSIRLLDDLKEARERLNRNAHNSQRPPSSEAPWEKNSALQLIARIDSRRWSLEMKRQPSHPRTPIGGLNKSGENQRTKIVNRANNRVPKALEGNRLPDYKDASADAGNIVIPAWMPVSSVHGWQTGGYLPWPWIPASLPE